MEIFFTVVFIVLFIRVFMWPDEPTKPTYQLKPTNTMHENLIDLIEEFKDQIKNWQSETVSERFPLGRYRGYMPDPDYRVKYTIELYNGRGFTVEVKPNESAKAILYPFFCVALNRPIPETKPVTCLNELPDFLKEFERDIEYVSKTPIVSGYRWTIGFVLHKRKLTIDVHQWEKAEAIVTPAVRSVVRHKSRFAQGGLLDEVSDWVKANPALMRAIESTNKYTSCPYLAREYKGYPAGGVLTEENAAKFKEFYPPKEESSGEVIYPLSSLAKRVNALLMYRTLLSIGIHTPNVIQDKRSAAAY